MNTNTLPGIFDCDAKQRPGEEGFKLLERDPVAPGLIELWSAIREGNLQLAITLSSTLIVEQMPRYKSNPTEPEQIENARAIASRMRAAQEKRCGF